MEVWYSDGVHGNERHLRLSEQRGRKRLTDWDIFRIDVDRFLPPNPFIGCASVTELTYKVTLRSRIDIRLAAR